MKRNTQKTYLFDFIYTFLFTVIVNLLPILTTVSQLDTSENFLLEDLLNSNAVYGLINYTAIFILSTIIFSLLHNDFSRIFLIEKLKINKNIFYLWGVLAALSIVQINSFIYSSENSYQYQVYDNKLFTFFCFALNSACLIFTIYHRKFTVGILIFTYLILILITSPTQKSVHEQRNIFLIGIDSLRPELINQYMPFLKSKLSNSTIFENAYTPFARTYPAWNSIVTGRHPVLNGARFNLQPEFMLAEDNIYLPSVLKNAGYQTVYAADERRFSNLGEQQGFDSIIGPKTGASDFILGTYANIPIMNLLLLMPLANYLLPELYANRAAHHLYRPDTFINLLKQGIAKLNLNKPIFMATHFCLPHWPYTFVGHKSDASYPEKPAYPDNLRTVDDQIKSLFSILEKANLTQNSIVVFLSDHGESWGKFESEFKDAEGKPFIGYDYGHGMNILSPSSHKILLAFNGIKLNPDNKLKPASLIDIAPTVLDELNLLDYSHSNFNGRSLKSLPPENIELTFESGVILAEANTRNPNPRAVAKAGAHRFNIQADGYLRLRKEIIPKMIEAKQRGLRINNDAIFMTNTPLGMQYLNVNYSTNSYATHYSLKDVGHNKLTQRFCELYAAESQLISKQCVTN